MAKKFRQIVIVLLCFVFMVLLMILPSSAYSYGFNDYAQGELSVPFYRLQSMTIEAGERLFTCTFDPWYISNIISSKLGTVNYLSFYSSDGTELSLPIAYDVDEAALLDDGSVVYLRFNVSQSAALQDFDDLRITLEFSDIVFDSSSEYGCSTDPKFIPKIVSYSSGTNTLASFGDYLCRMMYEDLNALEYETSVLLSEQYYTFASSASYTNHALPWSTIYESEPIRDGIGSNSQFSVPRALTSFTIDSSFSDFALFIPCSNARYFDDDSIPSSDIFDSSFYFQTTYSPRLRSDFDQLLTETVYVETFPDSFLTFVDGFSAFFAIEIFNDWTLGQLLIIPLACIVVLAVMRKYAGG